jgi:hypothetical protein
VIIAYHHSCYISLFNNVEAINMAPAVRKISEQEWKTHHETIYDLYHVQRLPLHSEKGEPSVQQMMYEQHKFYAR